MPQPTSAASGEEKEEKEELSDPFVWGIQKKSREVMMKKWCQIGEKKEGKKQQNEWI